MSDNKFDSYFRDRLQDQSSPVPADMWQRIHPEKGRRRIFIFWIWGVIIPILLLGSLYMGNHFTNSRSISHLSNPSDQSNSSDQPELSHNTDSNQYTASSHHTDPSHHTDTSHHTTLSRHTTLPNHTTSSRHTTPHPSDQIDPSYNPNSPHQFNLSYDPNAPSPTHLPSIQPTASRKPITAPKLNPPTSPTKTNQKPQLADSTKWYLDAYASPDLPLNHWGRLSYTAGFRLGRTFGHHFSGIIGLQYSHIRENITTTDSSGSRSLNLYLKTLDIPLLIGYRTSIGHLTTTITGGTIVNIHSRNTAGNLYKSNTGVSLYLGLNFIQPLNPRLSLFTEPYFRYRLTNMTTYPVLMLNKINIGGISFGLRYDLRPSGQQKGKK